VKTFQLFGLFLLTRMCCCGDTNLVLTLEAHQRTVRVGETINLVVKLTGNDLTNIFQSAKEFPALDRYGNSGFRLDCSYTATNEGELVFGPYAFSFNGQKLTSNTQTVQVLPKVAKGELGTTFRVNRESISLGDDVELVMESRNQCKPPLPSPPRAELKLRSNDFGITDSSCGRTLDFSAGVVSFCDQQSWRLRPKKPGVFEIDGDIFAELPTGVTPPHFAIKVHESAQRADETLRR